MGIVRKSAFNTTYGKWEAVAGTVEKIAAGVIELRDWQREAFDRLKRSKFWSLLAPMGSGKSVEIQALTYTKLQRDKTLRAIIAVPQTVIAQSFQDVVEIKTPDGQIIFSISHHNFFENNDPSIEGLVAFLNGGSGIDVEDRIALCSHAALVAAFKRAPVVFKNVVVVVDETHHAQFLTIEDLEVPITNGLGTLIHYAITCPKNRVQLGISTATFFRGDRFSIVPKKHLDDFKTYEFAFDRHLKEICRFEAFTYNFLLYDSSFLEGVADVFKEKVKKTIVFIPNVQSLISTGKSNDVIEVYRAISGSNRPKCVQQRDGLTLVQRGKKWVRVINLVDEYLRDEKKALIKVAHDAPNADVADVIVALEMFKEGGNWRWAEQVLIVGTKGSLTDQIQIIGRLFRPAPGKRHVNVVQVLPYTFDAIDTEESRERFNDYLKAVLLSMLYEDIFTPPQIVERAAATSSDGGTRHAVDYLSSIPIDVQASISREVVLECGKLIALDETFVSDRKEVLEKVRVLIEEALDRYGVVKHVEAIAEQIFRRITKKSIECAGAIQLRDIKVRLVEENPANIILVFMSKNCDYETCQELRQLFRDLKVTGSAEENKRTLLEMAKQGEPRPNSKTHYLGKVLQSYITPAHDSYDNKFKNRLSKVAPEWFSRFKHYTMDETLAVCRKHKVTTSRQYVKLCDKDSQLPRHPDEKYPEWSWLLLSGKLSPKAQKDANIEAIKIFFQTNKRWPYLRSSDAEEKRLGIALRLYTFKGKSYSPKLDKWARAQGFGKWKKPTKRKIVSGKHVKTGKALEFESLSAAIEAGYDVRYAIAKGKPFKNYVWKIKGRGGADDA